MLYRPLRRFFFPIPIFFPFFLLSVLKFLLSVSAPLRLHCMALPLCIQLDYVVVFGPMIFFSCLVCGLLVTHQAQGKKKKKNLKKRFPLLGLWGAVEFGRMAQITNERLF